MTDRLTIYNGALRVLGERRLKDLTNTSGPQLYLDQVWDDGGIRQCLECGQWNWASRQQSLSYSRGVVPQLGYEFAFAEPNDIVRLTSVRADARSEDSLRSYTREGGFFFADRDQIVIKYVSDDPFYGLDFSKWPETFKSFVQYFFAHEICLNVSASESKMQAISIRMEEKKSAALSQDAMSNPSKRIPLSGWARSRSGRAPHLGKG